MVTRVRLKDGGENTEDMSRWLALGNDRIQERKQASRVQTHTRTEQNQSESSSGESVAERRSLRAQYRSLKDDILVGKEVFERFDSDKFDHVICRVENLHNLVRRPREQIADAEALLDITTNFLASVKDAKRKGGVSPAEFVTAIIQNFGERTANTDNADIKDRGPRIDWEALGFQASSVFSDAPGIGTMLGPMESQPKQRKASQRRQRDRPSETAHPEVVGNSIDGNERTETDKNMEVMFRILRRLKSAPLEALVLNRNSFAQTVENIFALSFLVKDGRAKIFIEDGHHIVVPKNFPTQVQMENGEGSMRQFVFRFDFKDWKMMHDVVEEGKELMPHRISSFPYASSQGQSRTPVRKDCRNRAKETAAVGVADQFLEGDGLQDEDDAVQLPVQKRLRSLASFL